MDSNDLNFHQLRLFLAVAECGSFSRASERLIISQPAVSAQVRQLERALGFDLIDRSTGKWRLSDEGRLVHDYARRVFALVEEMLGALDEVNDLTAGQLIFGASTTIGEYLLPKVMGRFKKRYPGITLGLEIANTGVIVQRVIDRRLHLGLIGDEVKSESLEVLPYGLDDIVIIAAPSHRLADRSVIPVSELACEGFIVREAGSATRKVAEATLGHHGVEMRIAMELGSNEAVKQAVAANLGIGMISRNTITAELAAGVLAILDIENCSCQRQLSIIYPRDRRLSKAELAFLEMLKA
jgi:DNA-binding transcriptional LysR family regulator